MASARSARPPDRRPSFSDVSEYLQTPLQFLKGVGPKRAADLHRVGLVTVEDFLVVVVFSLDDFVAGAEFPTEFFDGGIAFAAGIELLLKQDI